MMDEAEKINLNNVTHEPIEGCGNRQYQGRQQQIPVVPRTSGLQGVLSNRTLFISGILAFILLFNLLFIRANWTQNPTVTHFSQEVQRQEISSLDVKTSTQPSKALTSEIPLGSRFAKIFWIYTENELETESMSEVIYLYHFNDTAKQLGYEVRIANSWNAYDWLSQKTTARISKAMQNSKVDQTIHNTLKLALLMENGGILINQFDIALLGNSFKWVEDMFNQPSENFQNEYACQPHKAYVYMFYTPDQVYGKRYLDPFIAAVPGSPLLVQAFDLMMDFIIKGTFPFNTDFSIIKQNMDLGVHFMPNSFEETINMVLYNYKRVISATEKDVCNKYGMQSKKIQNVVQMKNFTSQQMLKVLIDVDPEEELKKLSGLREVNMVRGMNGGPILRILNAMMENQMNYRNIPIEEYDSSSLLFRILNATVNRETFLDVYPEREVELCLIIMNELGKTEITESIDMFSRQTYKNWKQIMFTKDLKIVPTMDDKRLIVIKSSSNMVRNIELAVTKHCDNKGYAVLFNFGQKLNSLKGLAEIAKAVAPRDVVGAFITLEGMGKEWIPRPEHTHFHRGRDAIVNPKMYLLESILNQMRIFAIESFRYIPQFDLRDIHGKYFNDRLIFLMTLLEMVRSEIDQPRYLYLIKKHSQLWNVPRRAVIIHNGIKLHISQREQVDMEQLHKTKARLECEEVQQTIHNLLKWKIPFSKILAFNNGDEFIPVDQKKGPELIPRLIHQVWLGTKELPPAKQYFYRKARMIYPNYEMKLWREENITREAFPLTYDVIMNLIDFNKHSPYNKLATVTDIMRHEILYHEGGFWKDAGMNLLRPIFDKFLKYKIALPVDKTFRYRWLQGMCFFANAPKIENMWRITNFRNINRMRIYHSYASSIAGPIDFRQFVSGQQEYDPQILTMPYQTFYPAQVTEHPEKDLCTKREEQLQSSDQYEISQNGWYLLSSCSKLYPYSYAVEHNRFGDSWARRREQ